jgi:septal ring factor EnvC (AmiA/AmiB activator)
MAVAVCLCPPQALEAARKALQKSEAELAEASAESEAAAGEREQVNEQVAASEATIKGAQQKLRTPLVEITRLSWCRLGV